MEEYILKVHPEQNGMRLDILLTQFFAAQKLGFSRTFIQSLIQQGNITLGGLKITKPHHKVRALDEFKIAVEEKKECLLNAEDIPLDIVYQDQDLAVINKPCGLVVHPAPGNYAHTLVNALLFHFTQLSSVNPERPGIVHRLDKQTSGLLVIAKNNFTHLALADQFAKHTVKRKYIAVVKGKVEFDQNVIELPIGRHPIKRKNMSVSFNENTKYAKTYYRTLKRTDTFSLLELVPFTGRTHQLRVHLSFLHHPIMGDSKYGNNNKFCRLALHAQSIGFKHPRSGKFLEFRSEIPEEFSSFLKLSRLCCKDFL